MRLSRRTRRFLVLLHVLSAVSWIGVDLVIGALSFSGLTTDDPRRMAIAYTALGMFAVPLLLTLGLLTLTTGVILGLGTRYGLLRYWWVAVKLVLNLVLTGLVLVALRPALVEGAAESTLVDPTLPQRLAQVRFDMIFPPLVSTTTLLFAAWLGSYKPWGPTRRGKRALEAEREERARGRVRVPSPR
jgi:hypothetical protein